MRATRSSTLFALTSVLAVLGIVSACGADVDAPASGASSSGGAEAGLPDAPSSSSGSTSSSSSTSSGAVGDAAPTLADPSKDGPYATASADGTVPAAATTGALTVKIVYPSSGPTGGPYPVVVFAPGFLVPATAYTAYATRLASHGVATLLVEAGNGATDVDVARDARELSATLAWAKTAPGALAGKLDAARAGVMGHSRGGKAAVLAAVADAGFKGLLALDPVDTKPPLPCDPSQCPDASESIAGLKVPLLVLGETLDGTAGLLGQACAPAADAYTTFFAGAPSPAIEVTVVGAGHMSFVPDQAACGLSCTTCKTPTRSSPEVVSVSSSYAVAFFRKTLAGEAGWDTWLTGADASATWVKSGIVSARWK